MKLFCNLTNVDLILKNKYYLISIRQLVQKPNVN